MGSGEVTHCDVAVVGAGLVGLATARAVLAREPAARVVVVEQETGVAAHQSGHNSGVVHAGIYYPPGSLKARLCAEGRVRLRDYTAERGLPYVECGKLVVATHDGELDRLHALHARAQANGIPGLRLLDADGIREVEPHVRGVAALHCAVSAVTDYPAVARAYADEVRRGGGAVLTGFAVRDLDVSGAATTVTAADGRRLVAARVALCAGLWSDRLAVLAGDTADPRIVAFRGDYYRLRPERAALVRGLVYPVPDPALPFLGVHLTRTVGGDVLVGPNAVLAGARDGYRLATVRPPDLVETLRWPGFRRFARAHWRTGLAEMWRDVSRRAFAREARRYLPALGSGDLVRAPAGVRAQALDAEGRLVDDFRITRVGTVVCVRNAPSPAATSSLPIGEEVARQVLAAPG